MKHKGRFAASAAILVALMLASAGPAGAVTEYPNGGTWMYGISNGHAYSNLWHPSSSHRSWVRNSNGYYISDWKNGGIQSNASITGNTYNAVGYEYR